MKPNDNDNDNDNILFDHNIQIEIIMYNSFENQIIDWSGDYSEHILEVCPSIH